MKSGIIQNVAESIQQRLKTVTHRIGQDHNLTLIRYAAERFLYRLSVSDHASQFVLKGAMLYWIWIKESHRSTRDIDLLAFGEPSADSLLKVFKNLCSMTVEKEGLKFVQDSMRIDEIRNLEEYGGFRIRMKVMLGHIPIPLQVDIGFGDVITPGIQKIEYVTLLDQPKPMLNCYPPETVVAEKFHALIKMGIATSRMKDLYDLYMLKMKISMDDKIISKAVKATFDHRKTPLPENPDTLFSEVFILEKTHQWQTFISRSQLKDISPDLRTIIYELKIWYINIISNIQGE